MRYLIVILLYLLATASAEAMSNPEIDASNYLEVFADIDFSQKSILIPTNPYDDLWLKRISKPSDNHSAFRSSSLDLNSFDPDLIFKNGLLKGKKGTTKDYIKLIEQNQMNNQYLSRGYDENLSNIDHLIFESDFIASVAYSDLKFISENKVKMNQQKTKSIAASEDEIYLGYLDPYNLKRPDEVLQAPRLLGVDNSYRNLEPPRMASESAPTATQAKADNDLANNDFYQELSAFETDRDDIKRIAPFSSTAAKSKTFGVGDSFRGHLSDLRLMEKASVSSFRSADNAVEDADLKEDLDTLIRNYENTPVIISDPNPTKPNFFYSSRRENVYQTMRLLWELISMKIECLCKPARMMPSQLPIS